MSEHSVLQATQKQVAKLEAENAELRAYITELTERNVKLETLYSMLLMTLSKLGLTIAEGIQALDEYENSK